MDENGTSDRKDFYASVESRLALAAGASALLRADFKAHSPEMFVPFRDVVATFGDPTSEGLRLGVVTNGSIRTQTRKIDGLGIRPFMDLTGSANSRDREISPEASEADADCKSD